ncbi:hypothetical protein GCM10023322_41790 [Rugosimonospora acidiphila]|uniref:Low molecular weight protein antigen 6 PH domain-containing protein n=2 Tax=Rugosimonospora acidiphila TaxID=556531 RepID=A0ABP9RYT5_9ACTN
MPDEPGPGEGRRGEAGRGGSWRGEARRDREIGDGIDGAGPDEAPEPVDSVTYRVDRRFFAVKVVAALVFALVAAVLHSDRATLAFAGIAALVAGGYAVRDAIAPIRLSADREGVTVIAGYAGHHRLSWDDIERVRVDRRRRGARSGMVEIDSGERLYLLSSYDLNADPRDVVDALDQLSPTRPTSTD